MKTKDEARDAAMVIHSVPTEACGSSPKEFWREVINAGWDAQQAEIERLRDLLTRIGQWDMLDSAADGEFWKREIKAALGGEVNDVKR